MSSEPHHSAATHAHVHTCTRLSVGSGLPYDEVGQRYESTVPPLPTADLARVLESDGIEAARDLLEASPPVGRASTDPAELTDRRRQCTSR